MEMCKNKTFEEIMNEKVRSYLRNIKNEYIINENEVIHCINDEYIKNILIMTYINDKILLLKKDKIEQKEKDSFSYEQKFRDLKNRLHDRSFKESRRLGKKYNNKFNILFNYYQKCTEIILFRFEKRKKNVIQCINSKNCICRNLRILDEDIKFSFDAGIYFSNKKEYYECINFIMK